ncbi:MAG: tRNA pseudouridine(55) synthase TruB [Dehalococcoidia bacterium]|nr:tRNA pseudouridine(55) synthase TruB [Dehalococcoidia bacterium]
MSVDGILNVLKPAGKTSFDVVSLVRRWSGERRVGHAGTLDPDATGVLVVCLGQAVRIVEYLMGAGKTYQADIELGVTTDTYDAAGKVVASCDPSAVTEGQVRRVLDAFHGTIRQVPPMHSAIHHKGKRLYELARKGVEVEREPRRVEILRLELLAWRPPLVTIEVDCSGGTYVRSLAQDIGTALGCGAHLRDLVRLKCEPFHIDDALSLEVLEEAFRCGDWRGHLHSMDEVLLEWPAAILDQESDALVRKGADVDLHFAGDAGLVGSHCRAYSADGHFLAVLAKTHTGPWHPEKVFRTPCCEAGQEPPPCCSG